MAILSKASKTDNFESHNSLKLSFTNICRLHSNFVDCESSLESNSPGIFALCEKTLRILTYVFDWLYFTQCLTSFSSINHLLLCYAQIFILFHLTQMRLIMCLFLATLTSIIRTGLPILVQLIDLVNSAKIFLSQTTLLRKLTFLLGPLTVTLTALLFQIYFYLLTLVFFYNGFSPIRKF